MSGQGRRLTFVATPEIEAQMKDIKREIYFDRSQSEMIRDLMAAGMRSRRADTACAAEERKNA